MLSEQKETWEDLGLAYQTLKDVRVRDISCNGFTVRLQHNPGRRKSTFATVSEKDLQNRPCFLCPRLLPEKQKGILYRSEYLILSNPMPVFPGHLTISHIEHRPQTIHDNSDTFVQLSSDLGSQWIILYNGPDCGASAPDHLHFQAIPAGLTPIEDEIDESRLIPGTRIDGTRLCTVRNAGREVILIEGNNPVSVVSVLKHCMNLLQNSLPKTSEPMVNMAGFFRYGTWRVLVFPRRKHRPDTFFRHGKDRTAVSPAVVEMMGVIVTPEESDFENLDAVAVESIYREVSAEPIGPFTFHLDDDSPLRLP